jgi:hypothetical protein
LREDHVDDLRRENVMEGPTTIRCTAAWRKAVICTLLADRTTDEIARKTLTVIRNSWIEVANESEVLGTIDPEAALLILDKSTAGQGETTT